MEFETDSRNRKRVLIALSDQAPPVFHSIEELVERKVQIEGETLIDAGLGDWLGFYDWLRDTRKSVIGVRLWLDQDLKCINLIRTCVNVEVAEDGRDVTPSGKYIACEALAPRGKATSQPRCAYFGSKETNPKGFALAIASFAILYGVMWIGSRPGRGLKFSK